VAKAQKLVVAAALAAISAPAAAQDQVALDFASVNSFIEKYNSRPAPEGSIRANLQALRHRMLAEPFPIPEVVLSGSYYDIAIKMAERHGIPEQMFFNLVTAESNWDATAISPRGAIGLAQLMPGTADDLGVDPFNPYENLEGGARYLSMMYDQFGSWELALAAYNAGPGAVIRYRGIPPYQETQEYVRKIIDG